ncbi:MAG: AAA family ATPase [Patescibacteria group bacterium]
MKIEETKKYLNDNNEPFFEYANGRLNLNCPKCKTEDSLVLDFNENEYRCNEDDCKFSVDINSDFLKEFYNDDDFEISTCKDLLNYEVRPEFFIINPLIPKEAITSITADSGKGKSLFALILAYCMASGTPLFDKYEVEKSNVLIIDQEMNKNEIVSRFKKVIKDEVPIDYIIDQKFLITDEVKLLALKNKIIEKKYNVVILDTFTEIHNAEENDSGAMKMVNKNMLQLIRETGITIIYLHHHRKLQKGERLSQSSSRGSSEIIAKVSSHLLLDSKNYRDEFNNKILEIVISQEKARSSFRLENKISLKVINDEIENKIKWEYLGELEEKGKKIEEAKIAIINILQNRPGVLVRDLEEELSVGSNNIRIALKELVSESKVDSSKQGKANYYFLVS